jgi:hypothetical protein
MVSIVTDGFESNSAAGLLEPLSDVVVSPPGTGTVLATESSLVEHTNLETDILKQESQKCDQASISGQSIISMLWNTLRSYVPDKSAKREDMMVKGPCKAEAENQTIAVLKKFNQKPLPVVYRVHPLHFSSPENEGSVDSLLSQPYNVFVRRCCMPNVDTTFLNSKKGVLICKVVRLPGPSGCEDCDRKPVSKGNEFHRQEIFNVPLPKITPISVHVQLYVIEDVYKSLSDSEKEYLDKMTLDERTGHDSLLVSEVARAVLGTQIGARVNVEVVTTSAKSLPSEIQITPLGNWVCI